MVLRNLIFDAEVVEQRLRTVVLPHHKQPASEIGDCLQHHSLSSAYNLALVALASTNSVTFSTATPHFTQNPLTGGSIAAHVSAKFKKQRAASRNADNELQNPLQRRKMALSFFCVPKRSAISGDGLARRSSSPESIRS